MASHPNDKPILIVGGGIGGLAAALALAQQGFSVSLFEQAPELKEIGAGIQLGPNVFRMFERLGLTEAIRRYAVFPDSLVMMDSITAEEVTRIPLGDAFLKKFKYPYGLIYRADLHRVLLEACEAVARISIHPSHRIVGVDDRGHEVAITDDHGATHIGAALIGCDGLWSTVRPLIVDDGKPVVSGHIAYRAVLPTAEMPEKLRWPSMVIWAGEKVHLVHYPMRGGELFNLVAVFHSARYEEGWNTFGDPSELHERFGQTCEEVRTVLAKVETWRMWVLSDRPPVKNWTKGNITLLGDSAHPMLQYLAQGACMAIEDAVCLADQMRRHGGDYNAAFRAYQEIRYLRTGRVQIMARVYGEFYHAAGVARELRNRMLGGRAAAAAMESMDWLYGEASVMAATLPQGA